jgi:peptide/nickel transport system permease protein
MLRYVIRRALWGTFVIWVIGTLMFLLPKAADIGDPAALLCQRGCSPERIENIRVRLGLDDSNAAQYKRFWLGHEALGREDDPAKRGVFDGSLGYSFRNTQPVLQTILDRLPVTACLAIGAALMWLAMGIPIGILAATKPRSLRDRAATFFALTGVSMPTFFLGIVMLYFFFLKLTQWGVRMPDNSPLFQPGYFPFKDNPLEWAQRLVLPCFTLAFVNAAVYSRMVRGSMLDVLGEDYIRTARAKGLSKRRVTYRHGLRAALTPVVTLLGLDLGALLGGAIITEKIFNLNGVGALTINAITNLDIPIMIGTVMFAAFFVVIANIVVDILYAALDPRVRYS